MRNDSRHGPESESVFFQIAENFSLHCLHWKGKGDLHEQNQAPVILLHGAGANAHWWDRVASRLSTNRSIYALDFRGHGDSDYPTERFVGAFNVDLEAILTWLGREDVVLIGHSLGAAVALDHTSRFPATRGLALVDLARGGPKSGGRRARLALARRRTYQTREDAIDRFQFLPESSHPDEGTRLYIAEHSVKEEPDGRFGYKFDPKWFSLPSRERPDLQHVLCQTLLIRGGESQLLPADAAREFAIELPKGEFFEIPKAGHHVLIDQPDRLAHALSDFLKRLDS